MDYLHLGDPNKPLSFILSDHDTVGQQATSSSYENAMYWSPVRLYMHGAMMPKATLVMAVFASLAAVALLILKCMETFRRGRAPKSIKRMLSDHGESSSCRSEGGSEDESSPQDPESNADEQEGVQGTAKRKRSDSNSDDDSPEESSRSPHEVGAAQGLVLRMQESAGGSSPSPDIRPMQQSPALSSQASPWSLPPKKRFPLRYEQSSASKEDDGAQPSTSAAALGWSSVGGASASSSAPEARQQQAGESSSRASAQDSSQQQQQPQPPPSAQEEMAVGGSSAPPDSPGSPQPSTSSGLPSQLSPPGQGVRLHPFARLPRGPPGDHRRLFNPVFAMERLNAYRAIHPTLIGCRRLLSRDSLNSSELAALVVHVQVLVAHLIRFETGSPEGRDERTVVGMLGRRLLLYDTLVSTFQLLGGPPEGEWWELLNASVPHEGTGRRGRYGKQMHEFYQTLTEELRNALALLKTGVRPAVKDLVKLKRMLFCSPRSPVMFQKPEWDPWRQDDEEAKRNGDVED